MTHIWQLTEVPDERLEKLKKIYNSQKIIPSTVSFVDIAGLVKGAASGEGLGNQFLSHIREVDLILHVIRCFEDPNILSTALEIDPINDFEVINAELMLKDLESVSKRVEKILHLLKSAKSKPVEFKTLTEELELLKAVEIALDATDAAMVAGLIKQATVQTIPLIAAKKFLIIANVAEHEIENNVYEKNSSYQALIKQFGQENVIPICARLEFELFTA